MPRRNKQLKLSNLPNYLGQINKNMSPDTVIKLLCRAANCLSNVRNLTNFNKAIKYYTEAYYIQCDIRGSSHTRATNIKNLIIKCEDKIVHLKKD